MRVDGVNESGGVRNEQPPASVFFRHVAVASFTRMTLAGFLTNNYRRASFSCIRLLPVFPA